MSKINGSLAREIIGRGARSRLEIYLTNTPDLTALTANTPIAYPGDWLAKEMYGFSELPSSGVSFKYDGSRGLFLTQASLNQRSSTGDSTLTFFFSINGVKVDKTELQKIWWFGSEQDNNDISNVLLLRKNDQVRLHVESDKNTDFRTYRGSITLVGGLILP